MFFILHLQNSYKLFTQETLRISKEAFLFQSCPAQLRPSGCCQSSFFLDFFNLLLSSMSTLNNQLEIATSESLQILQPQPDMHHIFKITYQMKSYCLEQLKKFNKSLKSQALKHSQQELLEINLSARHGLYLVGVIKHLLRKTCTQSLGIARTTKMKCLNQNHCFISHSSQVTPFSVLSWHRPPLSFSTTKGPLCIA